MYGFHVYTLQDAGAWHQAWRQLPLDQRDVFGRPDYYSAFDGQDGSVAECAVLSTARGQIIYPYLRRPIHTLNWLDLEGPCFDLENAYGYGGPLGNMNDEELWNRFIEAFGDYCRTTGVVAEFVRLHPLLGAKSAMASHYEFALANLNVVANLQQDDETLWRSYKRNNRKNIKKALRSGVRGFCERAPSEHFDDFLAIYLATLGRQRAKDFYRFSPGFYEVLHRQMPESVVYFFAEYQGQVVSCELCLVSETTIYSFLGGTDEKYFNVRPNNLLKHELIRWARDQGLKYYLIGGGNKMNDGIFRYKLSFAPEGVVDFYIAKRIHNQERYSELLSQCEHHYPHNADEARQWFLRWRFEAANKDQANDQG